MWRTYAPLECVSSAHQIYGNARKSLAHTSVGSVPRALRDDANVGRLPRRAARERTEWGDLIYDAGVSPYRHPALLRILQRQHTFSLAYLETSWGAPHVWILLTVYSALSRSAKSSTLRTVLRSDGEFTRAASMSQRCITNSDISLV